MKQIKISLKTKVIVLVLLMAAILASCAMIISYRIYSSTMSLHYETLTMDLARTTAALLDREAVQKITDDVMEIYREQSPSEYKAPVFSSFQEEEWKQYYEAFHSATDSEEYREIMSVLSQIREQNHVQSIYLSYMDLKTERGIYIIDASEPGGACLPGTCDPVEDGNLILMKEGIYEFPAYITNYQEYGWLCSASAPVMSEDGQVIVNAYVDISMNDVVADRHNFLTHLLIVLAVVTLILIVFLSWIVTTVVIRPINKLAAATNAFVSDKEKRKDESSEISRLKITSGDEIENLCHSIQKMEQDINSYIQNLSRITAEKERIGAELDVAARIQADMLPCIFPAFPDRTEFDIRAAMTPAKEVGGDFYDFFLLDDDHLALVIADVSGKGVPAALFMVITKTLIKNAVQMGLSPKEVLEKVNNQLCENNEAEMFVTVWLGVFEISTGKIVAANAGHEYPAIRRKDGRFELYKDRHGFVLAGMENMRYQEYEFCLEEGENLFVYTDGVPEAINSASALFGTDRMLQALNRNPDALPEELLNTVKKEIEVFSGEIPRFDDITMLALLRKKDRTDCMRKLKTEARLENIAEVTAFLEKELYAGGAPESVITQIDIVTDEIFSNIVYYSGASSVIAGCEVGEGKVILRFSDDGRPYDPTRKEDPDITLPLEVRESGGLGIFMVRKLTDCMQYEYTNGFNVLTIEKKWDMIAGTDKEGEQK